MTVQGDEFVSIVERVRAAQRAYAELRHALGPPRPRLQRRGVPPTPARRHSDDGHRPPESGLDRTGAPWRGTSRILDPAARRRANGRTWAKHRAELRRAAVTARKAAAT